jgi:two-component system, OmpR family, alkaline phosphatase synthesis response regulator PhoP
MNSERILVVEDDPDTAELLRIIIGAEGFAVTVVPEGETALAELARHPPDLILLDLMLPRMDGLEVCRRARLATTAPIIMLTARTSTADKVRGLTLGADDYVEKPFEPGELLARIRAQLRRQREWSGTGAPGASSARGPVQVGALRMEPASYELFLGERPVSVTRLEFDLLYCLAQSAGKVLSRRELIDRVWGEDEVIDPRGIDAHIRHLREKIEDDPQEPRRIRTVHGVGYKLVAG